jgi:hypothetical protein
MTQKSCQNRTAAITYVGALAGELATMALSAGEETLAYLLQMAVAEASDITNSDCAAKPPLLST